MTIRRVIVAALLSGLVAGLVVSLAQAWQTVPLITIAETYETAVPAHDHGAAPDHAVAAGHAGWAPADGVERWFWTVVANVLTGVGFGFLLAGAMTLSGRPISVRTGAIWGAAGFAAFTLAPALGLPPVLPGADLAPLAARQIWWIGTALATAGGLWLLLLARPVPARALGVVLLALPHILQAPPPGAAGGSVPPELAAQFVVATLVVGIIFWTSLGAALGRLLGQPPTA